eukprot:751338-Hanusia_phi.AAC.3
MMNSQSNTRRMRGKDEEREGDRECWRREIDQSMPKKRKKVLEVKEKVEMRTAQCREQSFGEKIAPG